MRYLLMALAFFATPAYADEVTLMRDGRTLVGQFDGRESMRDGAVVILHDYLGHGDDATVAPLRKGLSDAGRAVLAINLSLGIDGRRGPFPCDRRHDHRYDDALPEIDRWIEWLAEQGAGPVTLVGIGGGAAHVALWSSTRPTTTVTELALVYPATFIPMAETRRWVEETGVSFKALLRQAEEEPATPREIPRFLSCAPATVNGESFLSYYGGEGTDRDTPSLLPKLGRPAMVIVSDDAPRTRQAAGAGVELERVDALDAVAGVIDVYIEAERLSSPQR